MAYPPPIKPRKTVSDNIVRFTIYPIFIAGFSSMYISFDPLPVRVIIIAMIGFTFWRWVMEFVRPIELYANEVDGMIIYNAGTGENRILFNEISSIRHLGDDSFIIRCKDREDHRIYDVMLKPKLYYKLLALAYPKEK